MRRCAVLNVVPLSRDLLHAYVKGFCQQVSQLVLFHIRHHVTHSILNFQISISRYLYEQMGYIKLAKPTALLRVTNSVHLHFRSGMCHALARWLDHHR